MPIWASKIYNLIYETEEANLDFQGLPLPMVSAK